MHHAIATVSLSGTLRQKVEAIAAAGFNGIELFEPDLLGFRDSPHVLRRLCADLGLSIDLYQPFRDFEGLPAEALPKALSRAERKFDLMQALGIPMVLVCSNVSPLALPEPERAAEQLRLLAERAASRGLRVGYEALAWGRHVNRWRQAWERVVLADHPALGLVLDSFHTLALDDDHEGIAALPGERIFFVQMADAPRLRLDVIEWARHHRSFPGQGQLDVVGFFANAWRAGYAGPLSLEVFNDVFRESPNRRIAVDARRSLLWLESQVHGALANDVLAETAPSRALFAPAPLPALRGWSFVEFAVDAQTRPLLDDMLRRLGFGAPRRHRSKPVWLYRQGDIRLVVNEGSHGLAREHLASHGPSVCAIALRCSDAAAARDRAVSLRSAPFDTAAGPGEAVLPSVVTPGGTVLHFVDEHLGEEGLFDADFAVADDSDGDETGIGLNAIDHLAMALAPDRVDTWVLFCRAILGLDAGESQKFADPHGLLRSFGLTGRDHGLRLLLSVSMSARTATAQAVNAGSGAVVQRIALQCDDVVASVAAARAAGVEFLSVPANWYDDLEARLDLTPAFVERLRAHDVMFDRDAQGDWLHACTSAPVGGVVFEFVQRTGAYAGFGLVNAPMQLAVRADFGPEPG